MRSIPRLAWVALAFAATDVIFLGGKRRAFGVFVAKLNDAFNDTASLPELNWIGDSYSALGYILTAPCTAFLLKTGRRYRLFQFIGSFLILISCVASAFVPDPAWLFFTHTAIHGTGSAFVISIVALVVNEHFKGTPYEVLARTLVSGGSVASIIFIETYAAMIQYMGWRLALIALGVIYFAVLGFSAIFFRSKDDAPEYDSRLCKCSGGGSIKWTQIPLAIMWCFDRILLTIVVYGMLLNLTDYEQRYKDTLLASVPITTTFASGEAVTYLIGAIIMGVTKNFFKNRLRYILFSFTILMATSIIVWQYVQQYRTVPYICAFLAGFGMGPSVTFLFPAGVEITTLDAHVAYPFTLAGMGTGMMISPLLTAMIAQRTNFHDFFLIQGIITALKAVNLGGIIIYHHFVINRRRQDAYEHINGKDILHKSHIASEEYSEKMNGVYNSSLYNKMKSESA